MSHKNNELVTWFSLCAQGTGMSDFERKLYNAAKPIVSFFDSFGCRRKSHTGTIGVIPLAKGGQINLTMSNENNADGQITSLIFGLTHQPQHGNSYNHFKAIRVELNLSQEPQFTLLNTNGVDDPEIKSGDPRKVMGPFLSTMEGPLEELFLPMVDRKFFYSERHLAPR